jgi:hypothetical protein
MTPQTSPAKRLSREQIEEKLRKEVYLAKQRVHCRRKVDGADNDEQLRVEALGIVLWEARLTAFVKSPADEESANNQTYFGSHNF